MSSKTYTNLKFRSVFLILSFVIPVVAFLFAFSLAAHAQEISVQFPIAELGNCSSEEECRAYCDEPGNFSSCEAWARSQGFIHEEGPEIPPEGGPGGCLSEEECRAYCEEGGHEDECLDFAVENGFMTEEEAAQIRERISQGGPGGCRGASECESFCREPENQKTCFEYAVSQGFIPAEEAERISALLEGELPGIPQPGEFGPRVGQVGPGEPQINVVKAQQVLEELGGGPGGCADFDACEEFCGTSGNEDVCFDFAIEHGLMDKAEAEKFKKLSTVEGPGGCKGRQCEEYCSQAGRERECLSFAKDQGIIDEQEFEKINRFVTVIEEKGGPGGCRGRECETFCNDPSNRDACFDFAKSNNLLAPEELQRIEKFKDIERRIEEQGGPGDCRGEAECRAYCTDSSHFDECAAFAVKEGFLDPDEAEQSLRQFIQIQEFDPSQGGHGFPGGFGGPQGFPGQGGTQGFGPQGPGGFPQGFENIPPEFRQQVEDKFQERFKQFEQYREQFEQGHIPQPGGFPGQGEGVEGGFPPPQGFPGQGQFPGGEFPTPNQFPGQGLPFQPREGEHPEGTFDGGEFKSFEQGVQQQFQHEFNSQVEQQYQQQFQQEFQRQYEQQSGGIIPQGGLVPPTGTFEQGTGGTLPPPPTGSVAPSGSLEQQTSYPTSPYPTSPTGSFDSNTSGGYHPPPTGTFESSGSYYPPPSGSFDGGGSYTPPPTGSFESAPPPPPPTSSRGIDNLFANILSIFKSQAR